MPSLQHRLLYAVAALALACAPVAHAGGAFDPGPTVDATMREWPQTYRADAVVEAVRQTTIAAQVSGRIVAFDVKAGDTVRAGDVLARIDARTADEALAAARSQVREAEANLANASRKHQRNLDLVARRFVSQAAADQSEAEYKAADAQLAAARANAAQSGTAQSFTIVRAPYAGVIGSADAQLGDMATPGKALVTLFDPQALRVSATVPQGVLAKLHADAPVAIELPGGERALVATRMTVVPLADPITHTARVRLDLPPGAPLLPGQFARARFVTGSVNALAVPASSLVQRGEVTAIYVVDARGIPQLRQVRRGQMLADGDQAMVEILAGVAAGEKVARNPARAGMAPLASAR
jgi:RND family efflux transporter MFP subunit